MNKTRRVLSVALIALALAACDGLKEAMTAHVDVVARAEKQELSVPRLAEMFGASQFPIEKENLKAIATLWVDYQLLGVAAARGDSLIDTTAIDKAMWSRIAGVKAQRFYDVVSKTWKIDTAATEANYAQGSVLAAKHILIRVPEGATPAQKDSARRLAETVRRQVTPANFGAMAARHSGDPSNKDAGGSLGVFPRGMMVKEFEGALVALRPGEISPVVETPFGYHIILRTPFAEVRGDFQRIWPELSRQRAESTYFSTLEAGANVKLRSNAVSIAREAAKDPVRAQENSTVIASSRAGDLTAARFAEWLSAFPPQARIAQRIQQEPDSNVTTFIRTVVRNELVLHAADSAGVKLDSAEIRTIRDSFRAQVNQVWLELGIAPSQLQDSAASPEARERLAAARVDRFVEGLLAGSSRYVPVGSGLEQVLHRKYDWKVNEAGVDRAAQRAQRVRATLDSTRAPGAVPPLTPQRPQPGGRGPAPGGQAPPAGGAAPRP